MNLSEIRVSDDERYHLFQGRPLYAERFDRVLKFHEPGLAPVQRNGLAWHINREGQPAYKERFLDSFGFYDGLAAVRDHKGWFHIKPDGSQLYAERYDFCGNFQEGRCPVCTLGGQWLHVTLDGIPLYNGRWAYSGDFRDGIAVVQNEKGFSTHINEGGVSFHGQWYLDLDVFHKGLARAKDDGGWMHVGRDGLPVYKRRFEMVEPFYNGRARVEQFNGALVVIDETGEMLHQLRATRRNEFAELSRDLVGYWSTQVISAAVKLGVFEVGAGPLEEFASACGLTPEMTERLLRPLGELKLMEYVESNWQVTERGQFLRRNHPCTLADAILEYAGPMSREMKKLTKYLKGATPEENLFLLASRDEKRREGFYRTLHAYALQDYEPVAPLLPVSGVWTLLDAGGGTGTFSRLLLKHHPQLKITLLDLADVEMEVEIPAEYTERMRFRSQDFFETWSAKADGVLLARVLHDWNDANALRILRRAVEATGSGGKIFVVEMLLSEENFGGSLCDMHLLAVTGGQERTYAHYSRLLEEAGIQVQDRIQTPALPEIIVGVVK